MAAMAGSVLLLHGETRNPQNQYPVRNPPPETKKHYLHILAYESSKRGGQTGLRSWIVLFSLFHCQTKESTEIVQCF